MRALLAAALVLNVGGAGAAAPSGPVTGRVTIPEGAAQKKTRLKLRYAGQTGLGEKKDPSSSPAVVYLEGLPPSRAAAARVEMRQNGLEFRPRVLAVQTGTTVSFPNDDPVYHNVFSYSQAKRFDLGRYPQGETKEVLFEQRGRVDVFCEIHEHMRAFIVVVDNPCFAVAKEDGSFTLPEVPAGRYTLVAWHESFEPVRVPVDVPAGGTRVDLKFVRAAAGDDRTAGVGCCVGR
jgi:plastocyanin